MTKEDKQEIIEAVTETIQKTVNGKIDALRIETQEERQIIKEEIEPFLAGWRGARIIGNFIKWVAGIFIAVGGALAVLTQLK